LLSLWTESFGEETNQRKAVSGEFHASVREVELIGDLINEMKAAAPDMKKRFIVRDEEPLGVRLIDVTGEEEEKGEDESAPRVPLPLAELAAVDELDLASSPLPVYPLPV
jgi:hypothetical protein